MQSRSPIKSGITIATLGLALAAGLVVFRAQADVWDKKTVITIDQPIQVMDTYLEPGTYVFKLANSSSDRHIVYIYNRDENHLINTVMAIPNYRLEPTGNSRFTFWETPPGTAKAMRAWFYPGDNFGQEFRYPKNLRTIAVASVAPVVVRPSQPPEPPPPPPPPPPAPAPPQAAPEPEAKVEAPVEHPKEEVVIAQNNPPPARPPAAVPAPAPEPAPAEPPQELPKTATPYPLIGLGGLLSMGLYALLRLKAPA